jgi:hypothetical protein
MTSAINALQLASYRANPQRSKLYVAGLETPPTIFACRINQSFITNDGIVEFLYDGITVGTYTDVLPGMTIWIGSTAGACDIGQARVRKMLTADIVYIGETSEIAWANGLHVTIIDEMLLWPKAIKIVNADSEIFRMDWDVDYVDQHVDFDPVPIMGCDAVVNVVSYPVVVTFPEASDSWVFDSTITAKLWTATAGVVTLETTFNPAITISSYPSNGLIRVALKVTAATGKEFTGYRYIHVYDTAHPPITPFFERASGTFDGGGWEFTLSLAGNVSTVRDRASIFLCAEDWYNNEFGSIGQLVGRENIVVHGNIDGQTISYDPIRNVTMFTVKGPQYWLGRISGYPASVRMAYKIPDAWINITSLTVDRAVWHLLHWRSTATSIMDVRLTGDERLASKFGLAVSSLLDQIKEIATSSIYAIPGCDQFGRLFLVIEPQLVPVDERTWPTIQTIEKQDWIGPINIAHVTTPEMSLLNQSGISIDVSASAATYFSLANGHTFKHYGAPVVIDRLLLSDQTQANVLAGATMAWKNNKFPSIEINMSANNRMFTLFPQQYAEIDIPPEETVTGVGFTGRMIPRIVTFNWNANTFAFQTSIMFEAEVFPDLAVNGDIPDFGDISIPPALPLPPPPNIVPVELPPGEVNTVHPGTVTFASYNYGVGYTTEFALKKPVWHFMNNGLNAAIDFSDIVDFQVTPSGAMYLLLGIRNVVMRSAGVGGTWTQIASGSDFSTNFEFYPYPKLLGIGVNPLADDEIGIAGTAIMGAPDFTTPTMAGLFKTATNGVLSDNLGSHYAMQRSGNSAVCYAGGSYYILGLKVGPQSIMGFKFTTSGAVEFDIGYLLGQSACAVFGRTSGSQNLMFSWDSSGAANAFDKIVGIDGGIAAVTHYHQSLYPRPSPANHNSLAFSPTGQLVMLTDGSGANWKSSDGGTTWVAGLPFLYFFSLDNCRDENRWLLAAGSQIYFTTDFLGTLVIDDTIFEKTGNLTYMAPLLDITYIRYIA